MKIKKIKQLEQMSETVSTSTVVKTVVKVTCDDDKGDELIIDVPCNLYWVCFELAGDNEELDQVEVLTDEAELSDDAGNALPKNWGEYVDFEKIAAAIRKEFGVRK